MIPDGLIDFRKTEEILMGATLLDMGEEGVDQTREVGRGPFREIAAQQCPRVGRDQGCAKLWTERRRPRPDNSEWRYQAATWMRERFENGLRRHAFVDEVVRREKLAIGLMRPAHAALAAGTEQPCVQDLAHVIIGRRAGGKIALLQGASES